MKILLYSLNHYPEQTGIGKYQGEMAAWFAARGHEVRCVTAPPYYPEWKVADGYSAWRYKVEDIDGARVYRIPLYVPAKPSGAKRLLHILSFVGMSKPVMFWLGLFWRPDVVIMTAPPLMGAPVAKITAWLAGARSYLHVQDFEVDAAFNLGLLKKRWLFDFAHWLERKALGAFTGVSTISMRMMEKLLEKGVPEAKVHLVPNWAGVEDFDPKIGAGAWEQTLKKDQETILALYSGNLGCKQGVETIVEAARLLRDRVKTHFVISGDGAARKEMQKRAVGLDNVTFLPVQAKDEFVQLMMAADIHLLPQKAEAADLVMPSKLGNILASGRPVVVGAKPQTQLYDAVQGCGLAVPPDDPEQFARAITELAKDPARRADMGAKGRMRAMADWSKESILLRFEDVLKKS